ncbi:WXG100 family type VII secretion target [Nocardia sp. CNY236]|uniref:WXG100 family type VII secretion target n=1 Tax=Nocardia sp. CNY236 TaxID=1169152 RepID=UPI000411B484|nr:WXG100 family type VII secretion target [Nocardia sp. CNY236]
MTEFRVDLEHLDIVTARMEGLNGFVAESLREVEERIAAVQGNWSGEAADAHATAHAEWTAAAIKIREGLTRMRAAATAARKEYESAAAANVAMLGRGGSGAAE